MNSASNHVFAISTYGLLVAILVAAFCGCTKSSQPREVAAEVTTDKSEVSRDNPKQKDAVNKSKLETRQAAQDSDGEPRKPSNGEVPFRGKHQLRENDWIEYTNKEAGFKVTTLNHRREVKTGNFKPQTSETTNGDLTFTSWGFPLESKARGQVFLFDYSGKNKFAAFQLKKANDHLFFLEMLRFRVDAFIETVPGGQLDSFEEYSTEFPYSANFSFSQPKQNLNAKGRVTFSKPNRVSVVFAAWTVGDQKQAPVRNKDKSNATKFLASFKFLEQAPQAPQNEDLFVDWKEYRSKKFGYKVLGPKDVEAPKNSASDGTSESIVVFPIRGSNGNEIAILEAITSVF